MEVEIMRTLDGILYHKKGDGYYWHREDGPAVIYDDGYESWWYYDKSYNNNTPIGIAYEKMPLSLFLAYCRWEYKKNGS